MSIPVVQGGDLPFDAFTAAGAQPAQPVAPAPQEVPDDLDQRVRQIGEWQLEDW